MFLGNFKKEKHVLFFQNSEGKEDTRDTFPNGGTISSKFHSEFLLSSTYMYRLSGSYIMDS